MGHKIISTLLTLFATFSLTIETILFWSTMPLILRLLMISFTIGGVVCTVGFIIIIIQDCQINKLWKNFCDKNKRKDKENNK